MRLSDLEQRNGEPLDVDPGCYGFRVLHAKQKGAEAAVRKQYGKQLSRALVLRFDEEDPEEEETDGEDEDFFGLAPGAYRFQPVDDSHRSLPGAKSAYLIVPSPDPSVEGVHGPIGPTGAVPIVGEPVRDLCAAICKLVDSNNQMVIALAGNVKPRLIEVPAVSVEPAEVPAAPQPDVMAQLSAFLPFLQGFGVKASTE